MSETPITERRTYAQLESELEYLRALKEGNNKTIQRQLRMIQNRNFVIAEKNRVLLDIKDVVMELAVPKLFSADVATVRATIAESVEKGLNAGLRSRSNA